VNDKPEKTFPVKLVKNYRPVGKFMVEETVEGKLDLRDPTDIEAAKVPAGTVIHIGIDEAKTILGKNIGVRNDPIA
jgi:hypothetical protein